MTYKQLEASREARLWLSQIIIPAVGLAIGAITLNPELRQSVSDKAKNTIDNIKHKFTTK